MARTVQIGNVAIGGVNPIAIQSMLNIPINDESRAIDQAKRLKDAGCDIIRVAVPDEECVQSLPRFIAECGMPVVADIHFDYRLAIASIRAGVAKVRINPGNIGSSERIKAVCKELIARCIPVRIGVNSGSLEKELLEKYRHPCPEAFVESAKKSIDIFNNFGFDNIVVSIKSSDAVMTYRANMLFREHYDYALHIGVTEAGNGDDGIIKSSIGIGSLLLNGVGETIRVSLTDEPIAEIIAAKRILTACGMRREGVKIISCPTCGRTKTSIIPIVNELKEKTSSIKTDLTVAVMGCVVNGPGEAREADIGIACGINEGLLFTKGEKKEKIPAGEMVSRLLCEIDKLCREKEAQKA